LAKAQDGKYTLSAKAYDLAGNVSSESSGLVVTLDTTAPAAPGVLEITEDRGISSSDQLTNDPTLKVGGTAEAGSLVTLFRDGSQVGSAVANAAGVWSIDTTSTTLTDNDYLYTATSTDTSGNTGALSQALKVTIDTATIVPTLAGISIDTGVAGDLITSETAQVFTGNSEAGARVELLLAGKSFGFATADNEGKWVYDATATPLVVGKNSFTFKAVDRAGNTSAVSTAYLVTVVDNVVTTPTFTKITEDTGRATDQVT
jgi:hypothetical protein